MIKGEWYWRHLLINATANLGSKSSSEQYVNESLGKLILETAPEHGIFFSWWKGMWFSFSACHAQLKASSTTIKSAQVAVTLTAQLLVKMLCKTRRLYQAIALAVRGTNCSENIFSKTTVAFFPTRFPPSCPRFPATPWGRAKSSIPRAAGCRWAGWVTAAQGQPWVRASRWKASTQTPNPQQHTAVPCWQPKGEKSREMLARLQLGKETQ